MGEVCGAVADGGGVELQHGDAKSKNEGPFFFQTPAVKAAGCSKEVDEKGGRKRRT
jgi:hypothetical protein